jgi:HD superfamily phosphodiesterase
MAILRHAHYGRPSGPHRIPHIEQLALHAAILALTLTVVLLAVA